MPSINQQLLKSAAAGDTDNIRKLLGLGANKETTDVNGRTPLHLAAYQNHLGAVRLLLEYGAPIEAQIKGGGTPLMDAVAMGHEDIVSCLLEHGANTEVVDEGEWNLLDWAAHEDHSRLIPFILQKNPSLVNKVQLNNRSPLHMDKKS